MTEAATQPSTHSSAPYRIAFLLAFIVFPALWNGLRFGEVLFFWKTMQEYGAHPGPLYVAISGATWFVIGTVLTVGVELRKAWAWYGILGAAAVYPVWAWTDRLFLQKPHANWPFSLIVTLTCVACVVVIMFTRKTKKYFRLGEDIHEIK